MKACAAQLLTVEELETRTRDLRRDSRVTVTSIGESRYGRPIDMISIGTGERNALIVGVPHPNEPVGAITVERMIALLLGPDGAAAARGLSWHFIKAIDPEGLRLNAGWLKKPRALCHYLEGYFHPAADREPEMTFPLNAAGLRFDRSTAENRAWQKAFALTRPVLHASLHHCEYGGVYHLISRFIPSLPPKLDRIVQESGLTINSNIEANLPTRQLSPSVRLYSSVPEMIASGSISKELWHWGEMSPGFGEATYGTLTIMSEVPLWDDPRLRQDEPSGITLRDSLTELGRLNATSEEVVARHAEALAQLVVTNDGGEYLAALRQNVIVTRMFAGHFRSIALAEPDRPLSRREHATTHTQVAIFTNRAYGMLGKLAELVLKSHPEHPAALRASQEARDILRRELRTLEQHAQLIPVPLETMTSIQMNAIFAAAEVLG